MTRFDTKWPSFSVDSISVGNLSTMTIKGTKFEKLNIFYFYSGGGKFSFGIYFTSFSQFLEKDIHLRRHVHS